jgi:hypothetical protein
MQACLSVQKLQENAVQVLEHATSAEQLLCPKAAAAMVRLAQSFAAKQQLAPSQRPRTMQTSSSMHSCAAPCAEVKSSAWHLPYSGVKQQQHQQKQHWQCKHTQLSREQFTQQQVCRNSMQMQQQGQQRQ